MARARWIELWFDDKETILNAMRRNLASDIEAGYSVNGHCIRKQIVDIEEYEAKYDREAEMLKNMEASKANHWCYIDLRKRGAIG